jgi:hypothetical protein
MTRSLLTITKRDSWCHGREDQTKQTPKYVTQWYPLERKINIIPLEEEGIDWHDSADSVNPLEE